MIVPTALLALGLPGCRRFDPAGFAGPEPLFRATVREFRTGNFERALRGFQRLTFDLPARDTLLPYVRYYAAECHFGLRDYVTAAREFRRVADEHPTATLAPDALLRAGDSESQLWRRPELDPTHGRTALAVYQELQGRYPESAAAGVAQARVRQLNDALALKEYQNAMFYIRRGGYESGILYLRSLIATYPSAAVVPEAFVRLARTYRAIGYREEEQEICGHLRLHYGSRPDVREACGDGSAGR
jgi:outer membrane assembly lipoprotein YfiO